jgi:ribosomal protein S18 acetylase RimI-like enzyme
MLPRVLDASDRRRVVELLNADPVRNVFVASRLAAGVLDRNAPGELWGYPDWEPSALLHVGANLVPVNTYADAWRAFASQVGPYRPFSAIVGPVEQAQGMWRALTDRWGKTYGKVRAVRERQPVMATSAPCLVEPDPRVHAVTPAHFESYFRAAVAMYTEELEEDPLATNPHGYRRYVEGLVRRGRAFVIVEDDEVIFKADIGAESATVAQVQGVWVHPRLRGRGIAAPAMAAVTNEIVRGGRTASLYVNDFNAPAIATYRRCGYTERGVFSTILY